MQLPNEKENEINIRNIILSQNCHNVHGEYLPFMSKIKLLNEIEINFYNTYLSFYLIGLELM